MFRLFVLVVLSLSISRIDCWATRKKVIQLNTNDTCCILAKLNINASRANAGRQFFAEIIVNNQSWKNINENNICSLMHFFMQEAVLNGRPIQFSRGMFVLYDSTKQFFTRLMEAKNAQPAGSGADRSGYLKRLKHFTVDNLKKLFKLNKNVPEAFIYVRGDESSHFRERGPKDQRRKVYPAYGMDVKHGCMPNGFGHILFGQLQSLYENSSDPYYGDRIYIKPEEFGLQKFAHYIGHSGKYVQHVSRRILCKIKKFQKTPMCSNEEAFRENIDTKLTDQWNQILATIPNLSTSERDEMRHRARQQGIHEIYRQTNLFVDKQIQVRDFQRQLETKYGRDARSRKGNEIIFTTEQLLESQKSCDGVQLTPQMKENLLCPMHNRSLIN